MANDINGGESTELLLRTPDITELPSPSLAKQMRHGSHAQDYFWPAGIASLTIQVTDGGSGSRGSTATGSSGNVSRSSAATSRSSSATSSSATIPRTLKKARWRTREFLVHYVIVALALVFMARAAVRLSDRERIFITLIGVFMLMFGAVAPLALPLDSHANYHIYKHRLSQGWLFGRKVVSLVCEVDIWPKLKRTLGQLRCASTTVSRRLALIARPSCCMAYLRERLRFRHSTTDSSIATPAWIT